MDKSQVLKSYKQLLRLTQRWPKQDKREFNFQQHLKTKIQTEFRTNPNLDINLMNQWYHQYSDMIENNIEKKYPLSSQSQMKSYLPTPRTYHLLDKETMKSLESTSSLSTMFDVWSWKSKK
ncbi:hypothetical protein BC833DRAFT_544228 [Globomyces pollinis-pini]|nr:hypothetical protein BC833DRAFT_544228 [Globomyces pollinis-pini]